MIYKLITTPTRVPLSILHGVMRYDSVPNILGELKYALKNDSGITITTTTTTTTATTTTHTVITVTARERSARGLVGEIHFFFKKQCSRISPQSCNLRHSVNIWSATCHNNRRKFHGFGGAGDTGDRTWDLLHQRADPHQLSYTCNFPLVLFLLPLLTSPSPTCQALWARPPYYRSKPLTTEGNPSL